MPSLPPCRVERESTPGIKEPYVGGRGTETIDETQCEEVGFRATSCSGPCGFPRECAKRVSQAEHAGKVRRNLFPAQGGTHRAMRRLDCRGWVGPR